ncbi:homocysteine S-methyltransferase family protein [Verrucosispora sp. WMMD1129]|uniref:homocysteine S-methyltransferase family protein n=1 Tax=Verrucosispora sp. WMMD1129 TaxID=3016093 RepID=UPI00249A500D|nr:homocysteine S-methyltransferase family protein [Verrucosispora sp. WMMD1129]WFE43589.1 homocysteine S-methyltransferase family protein [Verrucosispora sp. WMMD1129]
MERPGAPDGRPLLLDGALGTELQRHGRSVSAPWWTADCLLDAAGRRLVTQVHAAYVAAGVDVLTADTFRTTPRTAHRAGTGPDTAARLAHVAVSLAREAAATVARPVAVAGSIAPIEDCYRPELVPDEAVLRNEHAWLADQLARAGVDLVLVETMNTIREAVAAVRAARAHGLTTWASFVCAPGGDLLSGEDVVAAATAVRAAGASAVLVNCTDPAGTERALARLGRAGAGRLGAYPNLEDRTGLPPATPVDRYLPPAVSPAAFAGLPDTDPWRGLDIVGGCCGAGPEHIGALRARWPRDADEGQPAAATDRVTPGG